MDEDTPLVKRDERGKLLPGSRLAAGHRNPQAALRLQLHQAFLEAVGTDRLKEVIERHLALVMEAKPKEAAPLLELLYAYCLGKPLATVQMDVTTAADTAAPISLDAEDAAALEKLRAKLNPTAPIVDAEVIQQS